jgi:hypothetical protein
MTETDKRARIAGAVYLAASIPAVFAFAYVQGQLIVSGDPVASVARIQENQGLFRLGVAAELIGNAAWIAVPLALAWLFQAGGRGLRTAMVVLGLMTVPISCVAAAFELALLGLIGDPRYAAAFPPSEFQAIAALLLRAHGQTLVTAQLFWGLWLFPLAALIWTSGFMPRWLAAIVALAGAGWLAGVVIVVATPGLKASLGPVADILSQGELPLIAWLILFGTGSSLPLVGRRAVAVAG